MVFDDKLSQSRWDSYFMDMAYLVATKSKDESMKVGAVVISGSNGNVILSTGYNGFVRYADDEDEAKKARPEKYNWTCHGELNAICNAARVGTALNRSRMYVTCHPCVECARAIVQAGIIEVIIPSKDDDPFWKEGRWGEWEESFKKAREVLKEGRVAVIDHVI